MKALHVLLLSVVMVHLSLAQDKVEEVEAVISAVSTLHPQIGISVGFIDDDDSRFFNHGFADRSNTVAVDEETIFEIGSITKLFTAYLLSQQVEQGKIHLDSAIDAYLPDFIELNPSIQNSIKVSDLASHQSGLPDFDIGHLIEVNPLQPLDEVTLEMVDSILQSTSTLASLGSYRYSNISFVLLGYLIENVTDETYDQVLRNDMLDPLQMDNTYTADYDKGARTTGYNAQNEQRDFLHWNNVMAPAGLIKSCISDMVKFLEVLLGTDNESVHRTMQKTYFKNTFIELGLGLNIIREGDDVMYAKTGDSLGQSSVLAYHPEKHWGIVILTNQANGVAREIFGKVREVMK